MVFNGEPSVGMICRKIAFIENVFCDLDFWTYDLKNVICGMWTGYWV